LNNVTEPARDWYTVNNLASKIIAFLASSGTSESWSCSSSSSRASLSSAASPRISRTCVVFWCLWKPSSTRQHPNSCAPPPETSEKLQLCSSEEQHSMQMRAVPLDPVCSIKILQSRSKGNEAQLLKSCASLSSAASPRISRTCVRVQGSLARKKQPPP